MAKDSQEQEGGGRMKSRAGKAALVLGAAGLFLFIVGVKRRYRVDEERVLDAERRAREEEDARRDGEDARREGR